MAYDSGVQLEAFSFRQRAPLPDDFAVQLEDLVRAGRRAEAVELFLVKAAEASPRDVAAMRSQPFWPAMEAAAQTLAYEAFVMGPGNELPAGLLTGITQPTLVLNGGASPRVDGSRGKGRRERNSGGRAPGTGGTAALRGVRGLRPRAAGVPHHGLTAPGPTRAAGRRSRWQPASARPGRGPAGRRPWPRSAPRAAPAARRRRPVPAGRGSARWRWPIL